MAYARSVCFHVIGKQSRACWSAMVGFLSHPICISLGLFLFHWLMQLCFHTYPNRIQSSQTGPPNDNNNSTLLMLITTSNSVVYVPHCPLIHAWCTLHSPPDSNGNQVHQHNSSSSSNLLPLMLPSITQYFTAINPLLYPAKVDCKQPTHIVAVSHTHIIPDCIILIKKRVYILFVQYVKRGRMYTNNIVYDMTQSSWWGDRCWWWLDCCWRVRLRLCLRDRTRPECSM